MIDFTTLVEDGHVWHRSLDGTPMRVQANATFAHRLDWFAHCSFCADVIAEQARATTVTERLEAAAAALADSAHDLAQAISELWCCWSCGKWNRAHPCSRCGATEDFEAWLAAVGR